MKAARTSYDSIILAGDVGGTNTNLALIGKKGGTFSLLFDRHFKTQEEKSFIGPLSRFLEEAIAKNPTLRPELCCVSAAGPVDNNTAVLTNAPWNVYGEEIQKYFGIPSFVINDFTAVSYGVALLDVNDPSQIAKVPHVDGSLPEARPGTKAILGAGTGLGLGYLVKVKNNVLAFPSEGGHASLPVYDDESWAFSKWLRGRYARADSGDAADHCVIPGAEAGVSGLGITNIFNFLVEEGRFPPTEVTAKISSCPDPEKPAHIAKHAEDDPLCARAFGIFLEFYARTAANVCITFIPKGGLYLAGGIASKNESFFLRENRFMRAFEASYRDHTRAILASTPVYIVKDYSISLYGAANAAVSLS